MDDIQNLATGQIWRERDNRFERYVGVKKITPTHALIQTCVEDGEGEWRYKPRSREAWADIGRFNGKYQGYLFHAPTGAPNDR